MMTDTLDFSITPLRKSVNFTYSHAGQSLFRRALIRTVEVLAGQPKLERMYSEWAAYDKWPGESVFEAALRRLRMRPRIAGAAHLAGVPRKGGLLLVANHPFGIVDGLTIGHLGMTLRGDVRIMTHSLLCRVPELTPHLLPVDFSGTADARRLTSQTRRRAADLLAAGEVVAIFPGGSVATANAPLSGRAIEQAWHPFVGRLATLPGVTTLPVHFSGQNSRLFQAASHFSYPLRVALIFHETRRRIGQAIPLTIGAPIASEALRRMDRADVAPFLRRCTVGLSDARMTDPDEAFVWPRWIRW